MRLLLTLGIVALVWFGLYLHASAVPPQPSDPIDVAIVVGLAVVLGFAALVMLLGTKTWSARAMGLFLTTSGTAMIYAGAAWVRLMAPPGTFRAPEWYSDLLRALYLVGAPLLAYGIVIWIQERYNRVTKTYTSSERSLQRTADATERTATATELLAGDTDARAVAAEDRAVAAEDRAVAADERAIAADDRAKDEHDILYEATKPKH